MTQGISYSQYFEMTEKLQKREYAIFRFITICIARQANHLTHAFQVDPADFAILEDCILNGSFDICEGVPVGNSEGAAVGRLVNPTAAFAIDISGPAL